MTQDEIIRMAQEAGLSGIGERNMIALERFFNLAFTAGAANERDKHLNLANEVAWSVALAEREACAKLCDDKHDYMCSRAAAAIRARGN